MLSFTYLSSCSLYFHQENSVWIVCGEVWFVGVSLFVLNWNPKSVLSQSVGGFFVLRIYSRKQCLSSRKTGTENSVFTEPREQKILNTTLKYYSNGFPWSTLLLSVQKNHRQTNFLEWGEPGTVSVPMQEVIIGLVSYTLEMAENESVSFSYN